MQLRACSSNNFTQVFIFSSVHYFSETKQSQKSIVKLIAIAFTSIIKAKPALVKNQYSPFKSLLLSFFKI